MGKNTETLRVVKNGYNGSATFSLYLINPATPLMTNKSLDDVAGMIIRDYPKIAKRIMEADEIAPGAQTGDINFNQVDTSQRAELVELIAKKTRSKSTVGR